MVDDYVTGSMLTKVVVEGRAQPTYVTGSRGRAFSRLNGNKGYPAIDSAGLSFALQPWREKAGTIRNIRIFSDSERFFDSLVPNVSECVIKSGGEIFCAPGVIGGGAGVISFNRGVLPYTVDEEPIAEGWIDDFPFSPKYSGIARTKNIEKSFIATKQFDSMSATFFATKKQTKIACIVDYAKRDNSFAGSPFDNENGIGREYVTFADTIGGGTNLNLSTKDITKILFGFGDLTSTIESSPSSYYYKAGSNKFANCRRFIGGTAYSPVIRGWKYGLINGLPMYSSAVFRRDRYGQLRDILEKRPEAAFISDYENSPVTSFDPNEGTPMPRSIKPLREQNYVPPVQVSFVRQSVARGELNYFNVPPDNTLSSNLSSYATSSIPYIDGQTRNRSEPSPAANPNNVILNLKTDVFGNMVI
jgi:hypothetical protein